MGTSKGQNRIASRIFMGSWERARFLTCWEILPLLIPSLQTRCFQGLQVLTRTDNASRGSHSLLRVAQRCRTHSRLGEGILTIFPFSRGVNPRYASVLRQLGSTNPCTKAVHMEPFSTSVFKVRDWIFATTTKICTRSGSTQTDVLRFNANPSPSYTLTLFLTSAAGYWSLASAPSIFGASPFGRWVVTHSLAGFNFHDHRPAVKMNQHPFWCQMSEQFSTLHRR